MFKTNLVKELHLTSFDVFFVIKYNNQLLSSKFKNIETINFNLDNVD